MFVSTKREESSMTKRETSRVNVCTYNQCKRWNQPEK